MLPSGPQPQSCRRLSWSGGGKPRVGVGGSPRWHTAKGSLCLPACLATSSPWCARALRGEVRSAFWSPEYCQGWCGTPAPTSAEYRDFCLLILSGYNPCGLGQLCKNWQPWEPPMGLGLADRSSKRGRDAHSTYQVVRSRSRIGLLPWGPLEHMYIQWSRGWEVP